MNQPRCRMGPSSHHAQKIDHAGYSRYILDRNPKRFNEYGDELEDSESDAEADADAEDENPYSGIKLEGRPNFVQYLT